MPAIETERYEIEPKPLGRGGFGEVYGAKDLLYDREVVIKIILQSRMFGMDQPSVRHRFFREAVISARLGFESKYIVKVLDYGYDRNGDLPFFVMERVSGGDLSKRAGQISWASIAHLLCNALSGLSTAHNRAVIHSDISPDNILYDAASNQYKISDFGLSKLLSSTLMDRGAFMTITGGKPSYIPPDHWHDGTRNQFTDLFGLAVTIVYLVSGKYPSFGMATGQINLREELRTLMGLNNDDADDAVIYDEYFDVPPRDGYSRQIERFIGVESADGLTWKNHTGMQDVTAKYRILITQETLVELLWYIFTRKLDTSAEAIELINNLTLIASDNEKFRAKRQKAREEQETKQELSAARASNTARTVTTTRSTRKANEGGRIVKRGNPTGEAS